jgi:hypothetical protein
MNTTFVLVFDRHQGGIDDDGLLASGAAGDFGVPAHELTVGGACNHLLQLGIDRGRDLPPERCPEGLAFDLGQLDPDRVVRDLVDLENRTLRVEQPDKLHH